MTNKRLSLRAITKQSRHNFGFRGYYSDTVDTSDLGVTLGQLVSFTDWLAMDARITPLAPVWRTLLA